MTDLRRNLPTITSARRVHSALSARALCIGVGLVYVTGCLPMSTSRLFPISDRVRNGGNCPGAWAIFHPDGKKIVYASPKPNAGNGQSVCDLFQLDLTNGRHQRLTVGTDYDGMPAISPDGKLIAFISERLGVPKVFIANMDGSDQRALTTGQLGESKPVFSPDSLRVYFSREVEGRARDEGLVSINVSGADEKQVDTKYRRNAPVATTRTESSLFFMSEAGFDAKSGFTFDLMKYEFEKSTTWRVLSLGLKGNISCDISTDGSRVGYVSDSDVSFEYEVYVSKLDGTECRKLTGFGGYIGKVSMSKDGQEVLFVSEPKRATGGGRGTIYIASVDGRKLHRLGNNWGN